MQTSHQPYYSLLSLIMALIPSRWINIFIPSLLKPEGSSTFESKKGRKKERKKWRVEEWAQEKDDRWKGGSMLKWTNSKVTKPRQDFLVLSIIRLIYFPLTQLSQSSNYFFFLNRFLIAGCFFYDHVCKVEVFVSCCATLSPQTVSTDCTGRGKGAVREEAGRGVVSGEWARPQTSTSLAQ